MAKLSAEDRADLGKTISGLGDLAAGHPLGGEEDEEGEPEEVESGDEGEESGDGGVDGTPGDEEEEDESEEDDVPTSYMGLDLSDIEPETRKEILAKFAESDANYTRLSQKLKNQPTGDEGSETPPGDEGTPDADEAVDIDSLDDGAVLSALGYDPEDDIHKELVTPLARLVLKQNQLVQQLQMRDLTETFATNFHAALDTAEAEFGGEEALPEGYSREDVLSVMEAQNIADPVAAFERLVGPSRRAFQSEVEAQRKEAAAKAKRRIKTGKTRKPSATGSAPEPAKILSPRETARAAMQELREKGFDFG